LDYLIIPKGFSLTNSYFFMELTLYYAGRGATWNQSYGPLSENELKSYKRSDPDGRR
jgi:hypothetical protein